PRRAVDDLPDPRPDARAAGSQPARPDGAPGRRAPRDHGRLDGRCARQPALLACGRRTTERLAKQALRDGPARAGPSLEERRRLTVRPLEIPEILLCHT